MSTTFRPYAPDQSLLLPPDVREWLPEGHLAHHVSDLVDGLDLTAFYAPYEGDGRRNAPYDPGAFPISRSRAHTHRRHGHPLQTVPSAGLIERPQEKNRVDALR